MARAQHRRGEGCRAHAAAAAEAAPAIGRREEEDRREDGAREAVPVREDLHRRPLHDDLVDTDLVDRDLTDGLALRRHHGHRARRSSRRCRARRRRGGTGRRRVAGREVVLECAPEIRLRPGLVDPGAPQLVHGEEEDEKPDRDKDPPDGPDHGAHDG